uniref:CRAL-TRIO domain-containing protein n=1 Tax=Gongylonema pulchrum TaxID=637853 RepID=A0A183D9U7_9BILA
LVLKYGRFLTQTKIDGKWINGLDNGIVFVEMPIENPQKFLKVVRISEYQQLFFGFCEHMQNLVLEQEKKTGRRSHVICIFDLKGSPVVPYLNPVGAVNKLMMSRVYLWLDYYSELLKRVLIVNSSTSLLPAVISLLLPSKMLDRFTIARNLPDDLLPFLSVECIPVAYGGTYVVANDAALANTCIPAEPITPLDYQVLAA